MGAIVKLDNYRKVIGHPAFDEVDRFKNTLRNINLHDRYDQCCVCKWNKGDVKLALVRSKNAGGHYTFDNVLPFCPNHDIEFKSSLLTENELYYVQEFLWTICNEIAPFKD